jgi:SAM-dependent methyltransferase
VKILVAIASYGSRNVAFLDRLLAQYRSSRFDVHVVVLSNEPKDLGRNIEVRVGLPMKEGWSLPFAHRDLFAERASAFDLFIYSEDDTWITDEHVTAFLEATAVLEPQEIAGFMRCEIDEHGERVYECMHSAFRFLPETLCRRGELCFAQFSNEHSACSMLTRTHLECAIASGGFLVAPHEDRYDLLCAGGNDVYTQCGFTRLICVSQIERYSVQHLSNKYIGKWGVSAREVAVQAKRLEELADDPDGRRRESLLEPETATPVGAWWKSLFAASEPAVLELVPRSARSILVIGSGSGAAEAPLLERAQEVVLLPIDNVLGSAARWRGFEVLPSQLDDACLELGDRSFDCVIFPWILHLVPEPVSWLLRFRRSLAPGGAIILSVPKTGDVSGRNTRLGHHPGGRFRQPHWQAWESIWRFAQVRGWLQRTHLVPNAWKPYTPGQPRRAGVLREIRRSLFSSGLAVRALAARRS